MAAEDQAAIGPYLAPLPPLRSALIAELERTTNKDAIVTNAPEERFRLGVFDVSCLIINRMIGTGIFNSPTTVIQGTRSTGGALLLWFFGIFYGLAGIHVYIEYGLNVPRYVIEGVEQAVPRSGGDLHYLQFVYRWVRYKKDIVLLSGCLFGISFICVGNMASNCISFALRVSRAAQPSIEPSNGQVRAIAVAAAFFACVIHAVSRRGGIWLNNLLAAFKTGMLLAIIITTFVVVGGGFKDGDGKPVPNVFMQNMDYKVAFKPPTDAGTDEGSANGYAAAFLSIIFAYSGFDQANYVLGEIARPRRTFPRAATFAVALVSLLYMFVNICYMAVVPAHEQSDGVVALLFFQKTFGVFGEVTADRVFNAFLAVSSFGNIIVMTYTAARMKQEIAKQGFIPFRKFLGENVDVSLGRLIIYLRSRRKGWRLHWLSPENHREATPVGALCMHLLSCMVLIFATYNVQATDAYTLLSGLGAYAITATFGFFLSLGILILRFRHPPDTDPAKTKTYRETHAGGAADDPPMRETWANMTGTSVFGWLSILCASIYLVGNAFPLAASWYPATADFTRNTVSWWVVPTASWALLAFAALWWLGFVAKAKYREGRQHKRLVCEIWPEFEWADREGEGATGNDGDLRTRQIDGGKVLVHETVLFMWEGGERDLFNSTTIHNQPMQHQPWQQQYQQPLPNAPTTRQRGGPPAPPGPGARNDFEGFGNGAPTFPPANPGGMNDFYGFGQSNAAPCLPPARRGANDFDHFEGLGPTPPPAMRWANDP